MTKKIFKSIMLASMSVLLISFVLTFGALYQYFTSVSKTQLKNELSIASVGVEQNGTKYLSTIQSDEYRITWIDKDGTVLYDTSDSDTKDMENHLEREEVQQALQTGYGESERYSSTMMYRSLYAAQKLEDGTILRASIAQYTVLSIVFGMIQPILLVIVSALILSIILAKRLSKRIVKPLNQIDLDHPLENTEYDELSPLLHRLNSQQVELKDRSMELERNKKELKTIIRNTSEGMILLRKNGTILTINQKALELLGADESVVDKNVLEVSRNMDLQSAIASALNNNKVEKVIEMNGGVYQLSTAPIRVDHVVHGAAVVLFDITDKHNAEKMRREFTANVSHELKTPLHSISGYAELMKGGMVKEEMQKEFASKIYSEAQRMIQLVEDIITLSHLDEGGSDMEWESLDLYETALLSVDHLKEEASKKNIQFHVNGEKAIIRAIPALIQTIVANLCDNAIKYGKENGNIDVSVTNQNEKAVLTVKDDGIGISEEDQKRIFERFYRADKSHSRAIGGTGLGLSIVKHAVSIHHGEIKLESKLGEGTTITILFPKN